MAGARGEGYLDLDGETYAVLFTNRAIAEAEKATGKGILQLLNGFRNDTTGVIDLVQLLAVGLEAARREGRSRAGGYNINDAWRLLDQLGFATVAEVVFGALADVMSYRPKRETSDPPA
ncbi:MAG: GTA-gp10 family protein [Pseudomonadota bacterium]